MSDRIIMSKKRIVLAMEGLSEPQNMAWYRGTPHQDILMAIRTVSTHFFGECAPFYEFLITSRQACRQVTRRTVERQSQGFRSF